MPTTYRTNGYAITNATRLAPPTPADKLRVTSAIMLASKAWAKGLATSTTYWLECARDSAMSCGLNGIAGDCQVALEQIHGKCDLEAVPYVWSGLSALEV